MDTDGLARLCHLEGWQPHTTAPKDGTPILIDADVGLCVAVWETREEVFGRTRSGRLMPAGWVGFIITTEFTPATMGGRELADRFFLFQGLDEPFVWMPLPARELSSNP